MLIPAVSVKQPWADRLGTLPTSIETRVWYTPYRGPLAICAAALPKGAGVTSRAWQSALATDHSDRGGFFSIRGRRLSVNIDFNQVRRQAINAFGRVVNAMNRNLDGDRIAIDLSAIQNDMDNLRSALVCIACTYEPDDPEFKCVLQDGEILPALGESEAVTTSVSQDE
jgi:hypothetical protein